jgi:hypothetical protein
MLTVAFALAGVAMVIGIILGATFFREGTPHAGIQHVVVVGLFVAASVLAVLLALRLKMIFRESIVLEADAIAWTPPVSATDMSGHFGWGGGGTMYGHSGRVARGLFHTVLEVVVLWRERESIRMTRSGITEIKVEGKGRFEHLSVAVGKAAIDVAKGLPHDDRAWLLDTLTRWREGAD